MTCGAILTVEAIKSDYLVRSHEFVFVIWLANSKMAPGTGGKEH
jgi:hypothetical protein